MLCVHAQVALSELNVDGASGDQLQHVPRLEGNARMVFKSGLVYEGELQGGRLHGKGKLTFPDGLVYEGDFLENTITGRGVSGVDVAVGQRYSLQLCVHHSLRAGAGCTTALHPHPMCTKRRPLHLQTYRWRGGAVYDGEVQNGKRHGQGRMSFSDSITVYEGQWRFGVRHGHGTIKFNEDGTHRFEGG